MNKIDKQWYDSLKFLSKWTLKNAWDKLRKKNHEKFNKYFKGDPWNDLHELGHVTSSTGSHQIVTPSGMQQLRMFEDIRRKNITLISSVVAVIISIVALSKSMGWI